MLQIFDPHLPSFHWHCLGDGRFQFFLFVMSSTSANRIPPYVPPSDEQVDELEPIISKDVNTNKAIDRQLALFMAEKEKAQLNPRRQHGKFESECESESDRAYEMNECKEQTNHRHPHNNAPHTPPPKRRTTNLFSSLSATPSPSSSSSPSPTDLSDSPLTDGHEGIAVSSSSGSIANGVSSSSSSSPPHPSQPLLSVLPCGRDELTLAFERARREKQQIERLAALKRKSATHMRQQSQTGERERERERERDRANGIEMDEEGYQRDGRSHVIPPPIFGSIPFTPNYLHPTTGLPQPVPAFCSPASIIPGVAGASSSSIGSSSLSYRRFGLSAIGTGTTPIVHPLTAEALALHDDDSDSSSSSMESPRYGYHPYGYGRHRRRSYDSNGIRHVGANSPRSCSCSGSIVSKQPTDRDDSDDDHSICSCSLATDSESEFGTDCSDCSERELEFNEHFFQHRDNLQTSLQRALVVYSVPGAYLAHLIFRWGVKAITGVKLEEKDIGSPMILIEH